MRAASWRRSRLLLATFSIGLLAPFVLVGSAASWSEAPKQKISAQQTRNRSTFTITDNVNLVLLDVSVKSRKGGYVAGLKRSNFNVFEDGRPQEITSFTSMDSPVTVGLVVDNSGSMRFKRPEVIMAGLAFAKESNPQDEFFVVNFNSHIIPGLPDQIAFTDNLQQLRSALYYGEPKGQTALYDATAYSLGHLELSRQDKRTLIVVSDGGDNVSRISFPELMKLIEASRATIYTVGLFDPDDRDQNPKVLQKIAEISGGEFFKPANLDDVMPIFNKISKEIRNRYSIGYVPQDIGSKRIVRSVRVTATDNDSRKLSVRTRKSYITTPFAELIARQEPRVEKHKD